MPSYNIGTAVSASTDEESFATSMVLKYRTLLTKCAGFTSINVDGQNVALVDLERQYDFWNRKLKRLNGTRPIAMRINLDFDGEDSDA